MSLTIALGSVLLLSAANAQAAVSSEEAISFLNQQRAANGISGDLSADPNLALGCRQHDRYMQATGTLGHGEDQGSPLYTPEGGGEGLFGGGSEVLSGGNGYDAAQKNPWEWAPIHLYLMLDPERTTAGYDASGGFACMRLKGSRSNSEVNGVPQFFSYPGPGTQGIYPAEYAGESPYTPQQVAGIPAAQLTGPNILLFSTLQTSGVKAESFLLTGPGGPVAARMVDTSTSNAVGGGFWFRGGGVLIPEQPLAEYTTYRVSIRWRNLGYIDPGSPEPIAGPSHEIEFFTQEFEFTTGADLLRQPPAPPRPREPSLKLRLLGRAGNLLRFRVTAGKVLLGRLARLSVFRHERGCGPRFASPASGRCGWRKIGKREVSALRLRRHTPTIELDAPERWQKMEVSVRTRPFKVDGIRFASAVDSVEIRR